MWSIEKQLIEYCGWACCVKWRGAWRSKTHNTPIYNILSTALQLSVSQKALEMLLEENNVITKHVGATIHNLIGMFVCFSRTYLLGVLNFKGLTARLLYKSFGVKRLVFSISELMVDWVKPNYAEVKLLHLHFSQRLVQMLVQATNPGSWILILAPNRLICSAGHETNYTAPCGSLLSHTRYTKPFKAYWLRSAPTSWIF
jgi:hypothetical protein